MMNIKEALIKNKQQLEMIVFDINKRMKNAPKQTIQVSKINGKERLYVKEDEVNGRKRYLRKDEIKLAQSLAQKCYDQKVLQLATKQLKLHQKMIDGYEMDKIYTQHQNMRDSVACYISEYVMSDDEYAKEWQNATYDAKSIAESQIVTERGEKVRSKSEKIIADKLNSMNIPYRYEEAVYIKGYGEIYPDFSVLNVKERKVYYWEHFGMMDDVNYTSKMVKKVESYARNGYYVGKNLILTFENRDTPIATKLVEGMIKEYFK